MQVLTRWNVSESALLIIINKIQNIFHGLLFMFYSCVNKNKISNNYFVKYLHVLDIARHREIFCIYYFWSLKEVKTMCYCWCFRNKKRRPGESEGRRVLFGESEDQIILPIQSHREIWTKIVSTLPKSWAYINWETLPRTQGKQDCESTRVSAGSKQILHFYNLAFLDFMSRWEQTAK